MSEKLICPIRKVGRHLYTSLGTDTVILNCVHSPTPTGLINKKDELLKKHDCRFQDVMQNSMIVVVFVWYLRGDWCFNGIIRSSLRDFTDWGLLREWVIIEALY